MPSSRQTRPFNYSALQPLSVTSPVKNTPSDRDRSCSWTVDISGKKPSITDSSERDKGHDRPESTISAP